MESYIGYNLNITTHDQKRYEGELTHWDGDRKLFTLANIQTFEPGSDVPSKQRIPNETFNCDDLKEIVVLVPSQDQQQQPQLEQSNPQNAPYGGYYPEFHGQYPPYYPPPMYYSNNPWQTNPYMNPWSYPHMYNNFTPMNTTEDGVSQLQQDFNNINLDSEQNKPTKVNSETKKGIQSLVNKPEPIPLNAKQTPGKEKTPRKEDVRKQETIKPINSTKPSEKTTGEKTPQKRNAQNGPKQHSNPKNVRGGGHPRGNKSNIKKPVHIQIDKDEVFDIESIGRIDRERLEKEIKEGKLKQHSNPKNVRGGGHPRGNKSNKKKPVHIQIDKDEVFDIESIGRIDRERLEKEIKEGKLKGDGNDDLATAYKKSDFFDNLVVDKTKNKNMYEMKKIDKETFGTYNVHHRNNNYHRGYHRGGNRGRGRGGHRRNFVPKNEAKVTKEAKV